MTKIAPSTVVDLGLILMKKCPVQGGMASHTQKRRWKSLFGASPIVISKLWHLVDPERNPRVPSNPELKHLMWAMIFLRVATMGP
mmetsp:Transcript_7782/g.21700  ORF Transcript_7782/g.21700 Transcript_7782/m.21700 type:complete len:85 (-) Transcript_7782:35-289(-)|eukprot:CAMPEP_0168800624 /NCGR_PEP_ID=MMETSP0725-20121227/19109_1 /TAXON_ID=265536 /ORGANISM="Amphiprora sp., Strain CCMP467" /LENGTH=84 /DNA_ID=CAMNT_0008852261 /DNA_START=272 /DNA_END=526 /DNA_ORIENTATION=+